MNEYDEITVKNENPLLKILKWTLTVILIILLAILIIFLIKGYSNNNNNNLNPLLNQIFADNIERMKDAAKDYYTVDRVPKKEGETFKLTLQEMIDKKLILPLTDKNGEMCDTTASYTEITKVGNEWQLKINLSCGSEEEYIIVYLGCHDYCKNYICEREDEEKPNNNNGNGSKEYDPSCTLMVVSGTKGSNGKYISDVVIGFKNKSAGNDATISQSGVGIKTNYKNSTYTVKDNGTTTVYGYVKDTNGKTAVCSIKVIKTKEIKPAVGDPSCTLKVISGTKNANGTYSGNVVIGFDKKNAGANATLTDFGVGKELNYENSTYTVTTEGATTIYGYVKNSSGKTAVCNITITKQELEPSCTLKVVSGSKNSDGTYKSNVIIGFDKTNAGSGTLIGKGIGLSTNYEDETYTVSRNGEHVIYGYVKNSNGKTAVCSIKVIKDTRYEYLYEKHFEKEYSSWSNWSSDKTYTEKDNIIFGKQEFIWNEKNGQKEIKSYETNKNSPIWQVRHDRVVGTYEDYVCSGYTYYRSGDVTYSLGEWKFSHRLTNVSSIPADTATTRYDIVDMDYAVCKNTCTSKPVYIVDVYVRTQTAKTETKEELSAKCNIVIKDVPIYGDRRVLTGFNKNEITKIEYYYHTKTRTLIKDAYTVSVWSDSDNDLSLINQGYKYTGTKRQK